MLVILHLAVILNLLSNFHFMIGSEINGSCVVITINFKVQSQEWSEMSSFLMHDLMVDTFHMQQKKCNDLLEFLFFCSLCEFKYHMSQKKPGLELQILRGTQFQGHSRTPKATVLKNTINV